MTSSGEVGDHIRNVQDKVQEAAAAAEEAFNALDEANSQLNEKVEGSGQADVTEMQGLYSAALGGLTTSRETIGGVDERLTTISERLGSAAAAGATDGPAVPRPQPEAPAAAAQEKPQPGEAAGQQAANDQSEQSGNNDAEQQPEEGIKQLSLGEPVAVDPAELGHDYGVAEEVVPEVADRIIDGLQAAGIDPDSVLFAGYKSDAGDTDQIKLQAQNQDMDSYGGGAGYGGEDDGYGDDYGGYGDDFGPEPDLAEFGGVFEQASDKPRYDLGGKDDLYLPADANGNPIHYAGSGSNAVIGVYDKEKLAAIDPTFNPDAPSGWSIVSATAAELETAKVAEFHPAYKSNRPRGRR